jgi:superoxide dismutase
MHVAGHLMADVRRVNTLLERQGLSEPAEQNLADVVRAAGVRLAASDSRSAASPSSEEEGSSERGGSSGAAASRFANQRIGGSNALFNVASSVWNHRFFLEGLQASQSNAGVAVSSPSDFPRALPEIHALILRDFGSYETLRDTFANNAAALFGSGWCWLVFRNGGLEVRVTFNSGSPLLWPASQRPLLGVDLWEHAYYLDHGPRVRDYVNAYWRVVNWKVAEQRLEQARAAVR